jgi:hypothetical protein
LVSQLTSVQVPVLHDSVALGRSQEMEQEPQSVSVRVEVSQPLGLLPSQLPQPVLQLEKLQEPEEQVAPDALAGLQVVPQAPQSDNVVRERSQPLVELPSQLPQPELQETSVQVPPEHDSTALGRSQRVLHAPQLSSVASEVSQPLVGLPSQLPQFVLQLTSVQVPVVHVSVAFAMSQGTPQLPQSVSDVRERSQPLAPLPSQLPQPESHPENEQAPVMHVAPVAWAGEHPTPQAPQFTSVVRDASHPSASMLLQSAQGVSQLVIRQAPVAQDSVARGRSHATPQAAQLVSVVSEVSQPLARMPSQSPQPRSQLGTQAPPTQDDVAAWGSGPQYAPPSVTPSQLSSTPLQLSIAPGLIPGSRSLQSVPLQAASG